MKVTILGCGTSTGVPVPACSCAVCRSTNPKNSRLRTSVFIETDSGRNILVDTTPDFRQQVLRAKISRIDAVVYTHAHADHILGLDDLRCFNFRTKSPIPCFADPQTRSSIERAFDYIFNPDPDYLGGGLANLQFSSFREFEVIDLLGESIQTYPLLHGRFHVTGLKIGRLAYATDCNFIPDKSLQVLKGVEVLVIDGLRYEPHPTHFTIPQAIEIAQSLGVKRTILTHSTHNVDYDAVTAKLPEGVELAYDQMVIEV